MSDRFDLEQQIMDAWQATNDLDLLIEAVLERDLSKDDIANALLGLKVMQDLKFDRLFKTFENLIHNRRILG